MGEDGVDIQETEVEEELEVILLCDPLCELGKKRPSTRQQGHEEACG